MGNGREVKRPREAPDLRVSASHFALTVFRRESAEFKTLLSPLSEGAKEPVHGMRVAARRMRLILDEFSPFLDESAPWLETELHWFFQLLGAIRDLDIVVEKLAALKPPTVDEKTSMSRISQRLVARANQARKKLDQTVGSDRFQKLLGDIGALKPNKNFEAPALAVAPDLVRKRYREVAKIGRNLDPDSNPLEFHHLRKQCKKLRYILDFFAVFYGIAAKSQIQELKKLQDILGRRQDDLILITHLAGLSEDPSLPEPARNMAKALCSEFEEDAKKRSREIPREFGEAFGKRWKRLRKQMDSTRRALWKT